MRTHSSACANNFKERTYVSTKYMKKDVKIANI